MQDPRCTDRNDIHHSSAQDHPNLPAFRFDNPPHIPSSQVFDGHNIQATTCGVQDDIVAHKEELKNMQHKDAKHGGEPNNLSKHTDNVKSMSGGMAGR